MINPSEKESHFSVSKSTLRIDSLMAKAIPLGGVFIIIIVFGIFAFIFSQILPLFQKANFKAKESFKLPNIPALILGVDEWSELPFIYDKNQEIHFFDIHKGEFISKESLAINHQKIVAHSYDSSSQTLCTISENGIFKVHQIEYKAQFSENLERKIHGSVSEIISGNFEISTQKILSISHRKNEDGLLVSIISQNKENSSLIIKTFEEGFTGLGEEKGAWTEMLSQTITYPLEKFDFHKFSTSQTLDSILIQESEGKILHFYKERDKFKLSQTIIPQNQDPFAKIDFILGGFSFIYSHPNQEQIAYSLIQTKKGPRYIQVKSFENLPEENLLFTYSQRNKSFLCAGEKTLSIRYYTTTDTRWSGELPFSIKLLALNKKGNSVLFLSKENTLEIYELKDPHPESSFSAFFQKIWYEGAKEPKWTWQSTGGSNEFEAKLSIIPLIFGSLKGTLYAMLFSIPIAISAAIYTSQFIHWRLKQWIKSTMEIMASIPSVVLGFLAALWLAPLIEPFIPSIILIALGIPLIIFISSILWNYAPVHWKNNINGWEWILLIPIILITGKILFELGPSFENLFFAVKEFQIIDVKQGIIETLKGTANAQKELLQLSKLHPEYVLTLRETGNIVADFRLWYSEEAGIGAFDQRNSLVVGFMMGIAVIPIIFTISEDTLSNVPNSLKSASMALGASPWQTTRRVVFPIALAGIFSAIMIGFGRAIGETIIVVMATGNTPVLDWNIFNGMRTLSANIAMELPEAPKSSTHYRTLFLGAFLLFLITFIANTFAEILRQRISKKFKAL